MKTILDVKRRLAAARCPYPVSLMDDLEEAYEENQRLRKELEEYGTLIEQQGKEMIRLQQLANKQGKDLEEEKEHCTKAIRLLVQVTDTLSMGRTPDRAGAALKQIYKWLNENHPVDRKEGEGNQ